MCTARLSRNSLAMSWHISIASCLVNGKNTILDSPCTVEEEEENKYCSGLQLMGNLEMLDQVQAFVYS